MFVLNVLRDHQASEYPATLPDWVIMPDNRHVNVYNHHFNLDFKHRITVKYMQKQSHLDQD